MPVRLCWSHWCHESITSAAVSRKGLILKGALCRHIHEIFAHHSTVWTKNSAACVLWMHADLATFSSDVWVCLTTISPVCPLSLFWIIRVSNTYTPIHLTASEGHHGDENWQTYTDNPAAAEGQTHLFDVVILSIFLGINGLWPGCD